MPKFRELGVDALKVLVIGKGGPSTPSAGSSSSRRGSTAVFCARATRARRSTSQNVPIEPGDFRGLVQFAKREGIGLTVVGPEEPLVKGIVDVFQREGLRIFGPRKEAAELEGSKVFAKELMRQAGIPTADYRVFRSAPDAEHYVLSREVALVVRSRGRSTIRHTLHCRTAAETLEAIDRIMDPREMLRPGVQVEIEERGQKRVFNTAAEARDFVLGRPLGLVLKADGLAAGKGVLRLRQPPPGARGDRPDHGPPDLRPGRRPADHRGAARRPGGQRPGDHRRPDDHPAGIEPGLQAGLRPRRRARTPAAWGRSPRRRSSRPS